MLSKVKEALKLQEDYLKDADIKRNAVVDGYTDFVFVNRFGENLNHETLNKALRRIVRDYNLEEIEKATKENREAILLPKISTHILRHMFPNYSVSVVNIKVRVDEVDDSSYAQHGDQRTDADTDDFSF